MRSSRGSVWSFTSQVASSDFKCRRPRVVFSCPSDIQNVGHTFYARRPYGAWRRNSLCKVSFQFRRGVCEPFPSLSYRPRDPLAISAGSLASRMVAEKPADHREAVTPGEGPRSEAVTWITGWRKPPTACPVAREAVRDRVGDVLQRVQRRWPWRAVVWTWVWPRRLAIIGRLRPSASALEANE